MRMISTYLADEKDKVWLACFIDSEGSIFLSRRFSKKTGNVEYQAFSTIYNNHKSMIDRAAYLMNTSNVREKKRSIIDRVKRKQTYYTWVSKRDHLLLILEEILPYLMAKKKQAQIMIDWLKSRKIKRKYDEEDNMIFMKLANLNRKGPIIC